MTDTQPSIDNRDLDGSATLIITPTYLDSRTGALYVHRDLHQVREDWATEVHISPIEEQVALGDVASWAEYIKRFSGAPDYPPFLSWNASGLYAVIDYHVGVDEPARCSWLATCPFVYSPEWSAWKKLASGSAVGQRQLVEALEDLAEDIREPDAARLMELLRSLRANVQTTAATSLQPDGSTSVAWGQDKTLTGGKPGALELPGILTIAVPVLKGDPQPYQLVVRLRVTIGDDGKLTFRLSLVNAERVLEAVYEDRVRQAVGSLGEGFTLLRAADV